MATSELHRSISTIYRLEAARIIARLTRIVRDVGVAEESAHDALVAALSQWPESGTPDNPGAWLMATAKHHAINRVRREQLDERKRGELAPWEAERERVVPDLETAVDENVGDDMLRLILIACHPMLPIEARVALTLRLLGGLTTDEIARAFLVSEATVAQRIVRAKRSLAEAHVPFEVPRGTELERRLSSVLGVIYLIFNEGYSASSGDDLIRPDLCEDALRLGRMLAALAPNEPEVHGLVALMELTAARAPARLGPTGEPVLLLEQERSRWDPLLISRGLSALARAQALAGKDGPYGLQATIASCHARARSAADTDWARIAELYGDLAQIQPSAVVRLNRAVAIAMAFGAVAGLEQVDRLASEPSLQAYHLLPSVRGDLLAKLGRFDEARSEFERAASFTHNARQRTQLLERAAACGRTPPPSERN